MSILEKYTDIKNPGSFSGYTGFFKNNKNFSIKNIKNELSKIDSYTKHKPIKKSFERSKTYVPSIDHTWQIDLVDVSNLKNKKLAQFYSFLFVCIDVFSKYAFVEPIKNKSAEETTKAFTKILNSSNRKPFIVYSDNGKEFLGAFKKLLIKSNIKQIFTKSIFKAAVIERFNRTLKERMYRVFSFQKSNNYITILNDLVHSYNNSYHSSIKMSPSQVNKKNESEVHNNLYNDEKIFKTLIKFKFKIGDYVRIPIKKKIFDKGYTPNWSNEIYIIHTLIPSIQPKYMVTNLDDKLMDNKFYKEELQNVIFKEFPYDSLRVIDIKDNKLLIKKLNSEKQKEVWVNKKDYIEEGINNVRETRSKFKNNKQK